MPASFFVWKKKSLLMEVWTLETYYKKVFVSKMRQHYKEKKRFCENLFLGSISIPKANVSPFKKFLVAGEALWVVVMAFARKILSKHEQPFLFQKESQSNLFFFFFTKILFYFISLNMYFSLSWTKSLKDKLELKKKKIGRGKRISIFFYFFDPLIRPQFLSLFFIRCFYWLLLILYSLFPFFVFKVCFLFIFLFICSIIYIYIYFVLSFGREH